jgi:glycine cleavage system transcriptional repressor
MSLFAVTVLGRDRPGIVAETTTALAGLGGNLEDSTMTLLRGQFAMVLLVRTQSARPQVEAALAGLTADGSLSVDVRDAPDPSAASPAVPGDGGSASYLLSVHGADRPGIVGALTSVVAEAGGNVTDLTTRLSGSLYVLVAEVQLPTGGTGAGGGVDVERLIAAIAHTAERLGVDATLRPVETDEL